jgi:hypothetical protein
MADTVVQMNYDRVEGVAKGFDVAEQIVSAVAQLVIQTLEMMKSAPLVGQLIAPRLTQWQQDIREKSRALMKKLNEMAQDLRDAIEDHKRGDVAGKKYFMKGVRL